MKVAGQSLSRPYVVGLVATVAGGALTSGLLLTSSMLDNRALVAQQRAQRTIDTLPLSASLRAMNGDVDCQQVNIDRCLFSRHTPPDALKDVESLLAATGRVVGASCGPSTRPEVARCGFDTAVDGVPVRVLLWPHISTDSGLKFEGTDVWIDIRTDSDV